MDLNTDKAGEIEEQLKALRIAEIRARDRSLKPVGACHWCEEPFPKGDNRIYCGEECREDHAKERRMKSGGL